MQTKIIERYFFFTLFFGTLLFTFLIFRPFWVVIILGISFAIVLYPVYEWLKKAKMPDWLASFITVILFIFILCGPLLGIGTVVFKQSNNVYSQVAGKSDTVPLISSIEQGVNQFLPGTVKLDLNQKMSDFVSYVSDNIAKIFTGTVSAFFSFLLILLIIFYLLKDGRKLKQSIVILSPLIDRDDEKIISKLAQAVNAVIKGYLLIALLQGILLGLGFWVFGLANGALWGMVAAVMSLIPTFGTSLVSIPAILFLFATGHTMSALGLLLWAAFLVGTIDNFLSPLVVGKRINIPSIFILFSVLGGISFLGPVGILVGPLTLSLLYALISIYRNEFKQNAVL